MGEFLVHGELEVPQRRSVQSVHVQEQVVKVEALGAVGRPRDVARKWLMSFEGLGVVFVLRAVKIPSGGTDQGRIEPFYRVVGFYRGTGRGGRVRSDPEVLSPEVRMHWSLGVLEFSDRSARYVLDDCFQVPACPAARWTISR